MIFANLIQKSLDVVLADFDTTGVMEAYEEPHRYYHNLHHISDILANLELLVRLYALDEDDVASLHLTTWYHDIVYSPKSKINEENSVKEFLLKGNDPVVWRDITGTILGTKTHQNPETFLAAIFFDLDLAGLGADMYEENSRNIRKEFAHLSEDEWKAGRKNFIESLLQRPLIYHTSWGSQFEVKARDNLRAELRGLDAGGR